MAHILTWLGTASAHPAAFAIVVIYGIGWYFIDRESFDWHGFATLATWTMTLFIQRAEHRDTQAIHAKLDELLRVEDEARSDLTKIDAREPEEIEEHREREGAGNAGSDRDRKG
jgi:low affinity Fe/Cu permease